MKINKKLAIKILKYLDKHRDFYFPFQVICKEYEDESIEPSEWDKIKSDRKYQIFELQENLQDLGVDTTKLLAQGFIEKITGESLDSQMLLLAKNYRKAWKEKLWESEDIEEFGLNEFIGGKAEAYEDCLELIRKYKNFQVDAL